MRLVESLRIIALRHTGSGRDAIVDAAAANDLPPLPDAGRFAGTDPFVVWRNPGEWVLVAVSAAEIVDEMLGALAPGREPDACAVDQTDGAVCVELQGAGLDGVLSRLIDANAPQSSGEGTRTGLGSIAVIVLRMAEDRVWLLADRSVTRYLIDWLAYAIDRRQDSG